MDSKFTAEDLIVKMPAPLLNECERTLTWETSSPSIPLPRPTISPRVSLGSTASLKTRQRISSPLQLIGNGDERAAPKSLVYNGTDEEECSGGNVVFRREDARGLRERGRRRFKKHHDARQRAMSIIRPPQSTNKYGEFVACRICQSNTGEKTRSTQFRITSSPSSRITVPFEFKTAVMDCESNGHFYRIPLVTNHSERLSISKSHEDPGCRRSRSEVRRDVICKYKENLSAKYSFIGRQGRTSAFQGKKSNACANSGAMVVYTEPRNLLRSSALGKNTGDGKDDGDRKGRSRKTYRNCGRASRDRTKSKTRFLESHGVLTVWPGKSGVWLPM